MAEFNGKNRRRSVRIDIKAIRENRNRILKSIPAIGFFPFVFLIFNIFDSHSIRIAIPLVLILGLFIYLVGLSLYKKNFMLTLGIILVVPMFLSASLAISDFAFFDQRTIMTAFPKSVSPSADFLLGTDYEGRDIASTLIVGGMNAYLVAAIATLIALIAGIPTGLLLTMKNMVARNIALVITQFFEIVPQLFFVLILLGVFNFWAAASAGTRLVAAYAVPMAGFAIGISSLPSVARIIESRVSQLKAKRFVVALRSSNVGSAKILFYNILWKNCISEIVVQATFLFGATILIESALGYAFEIGFGELGTGGYLSWGKILAEGRRSLLFGENLWIVLFPILVTIMSILGINIIGDTLAKFLRSEA